MDGKAAAMGDLEAARHACSLSQKALEALDKLLEDATEADVRSRLKRAMKRVLSQPCSSGHVRNVLDVEAQVWICPHVLQRAWQSSSGPRHTYMCLTAWSHTLMFAAQSHTVQHVLHAHVLQLCMPKLSSLIPFQST